MKGYILLILSALFLVVVLVSYLIFISDEKWNGYVKTQNNPNSQWNFVDKVMVITFNSSKAYQDSLREKFKRIKPTQPAELLIFKGYNDFGLLGYVRSHAFSLKTAIKNNWNNLLVIDDNSIWNNYDESYKVLEKIVRDNPNYDVITLGNKNADFDQNTFKLKSGDSISGYLVNGKYLKKLYDIFNYSEDSLRSSSSINLIKDSKLRNEKRKELETEYSPDNLWKKLQKEDNWFIVNPALMVKEN